MPNSGCQSAQAPARFFPDRTETHLLVVVSLRYFVPNTLPETSMAITLYIQKKGMSTQYYGLCTLLMFFKDSSNRPHHTGILSGDARHSLPITYGGCTVVVIM